MEAPAVNAPSQSLEQSLDSQRSKAQRTFLANARAHLATLKASLEASRSNPERSPEVLDVSRAEVEEALEEEDALRVRSVRQVLADAAAAPPDEWVENKRAVNEALMDLEKFLRAEQAELLKSRMDRVARSSESQAKASGGNR